MTRIEILAAVKRGADLSRADLSRADLSYAYLSGAYLSGANLSDADLSDAYLSRAYLSRANLSDAYLSRADLSYADLSRANLSGADLSGAKLSYANLSRAKLSYANLSRANLSGANLEETKGDILYAHGGSGYRIVVTRAGGGVEIRSGCLFFRSWAEAWSHWARHNDAEHLLDVRTALSFLQSRAERKWGLLTDGTETTAAQEKDES